MNTEENWPESSQHLCEPISREEVSWALKEMQLQGLIVYIVIDMMLRERLFEVWVALFEACWEDVRVPFFVVRECWYPRSKQGEYVM